MAKKIDSNPKGGKRYPIDIDPSVGGDFPEQRTVTVVLPETGAEGLLVYQKDMPRFLKNVTYKRGNDDRPVHWLNVFGMKKSETGNYEIDVARYTVILDKVPNATYVYYDGPMGPGDQYNAQYLHPLTVSDVSGDVTKVQATLDKGDPAAGWVN